MSYFDAWWDQADNRRHRLPSTTQAQIKDFVHYAFEAGRSIEKSRVKEPTVHREAHPHTVAQMEHDTGSKS